MKTLKIMGIALCALMLQTCDAFLAPLEQRNNTKDPNGIYEAVSLRLNPTADGFVASTPETQFTLTYMMAGSPGTIYYSLVKFDVSQVPDIIEKARLRLYNSSAAASGVRACRILTTWDPATVAFTDVSAAGFHADPNSSPEATAAPATYCVWDVTPQVRTGAGNGFCIVFSQAMTLNFNTMEMGTTLPELVIDGYNYRQ